MNLNQLIPIYKNHLNQDDADAKAFDLNDINRRIYNMNQHNHPSWK